MTRSVLDRNLEALLSHAYRPVRCPDAARRRLERQFMRGFDALHGSRREAVGAAPFVVHHRRPLAAAAALVLLLLGAGTWSLVGGPGTDPAPLASECDAILARGLVAYRAPGEVWRSSHAAALDVSSGGLEVATPPGRGIALESAGTRLLRLGSASRASLLPGEEDDAPRFDLLAGTATVSGTLALEGRAGAARLAGSVDLAWTDPARDPELARRLRAGSRPPGRAFLALTVTDGEATRGATRLGSGERGWLCEGELLRPLPPQPELSGGADSGRSSLDVLPVPDESSGSPSEEPAGGARLTLAVTEARDGSPLERFKVTLVEALPLPELGRRAARSVSAESGVTTLEDLPEGRFRVFVHAPGHAMFQAEPVELVAGTPASLECALDVGARVLGRVVDAASGRPIPDALVISETDAATVLLPLHDLTEFASDLPTRTRTGADGTFELAHVSQTAQVLRFSHPDHAPSWITLDARTGSVFTEVDAALPAAGRVHGSVDLERFPDGRPVLIASFFDFTGRRPGMSFSSAQPSDDGAYAIGGLPVQQGVVLILENDRALEPLGLRFFESRADRSVRVDFADDPGAADVRGRLVDAEGRALGGWAVTLMKSDVSGRVATIESSQAAVVGADGSFAFTDLEPGAYAAYVSRTIGPHLTFVRELELAPGAQELELSVLPFTLAGRVTDRAGAAVESVTVLCEALHDEELPFGGKALTDGDGHYRIEGLQPGTYRLLFIPQEVGTAFREETGILLAPGREVVDVSVALDAGTAVELLVRDERGQAVVGAAVRFITPEGERLRLGPLSFTDSDGRYVAAGLALGGWQVAVRAADFEEELVSFELEPETPMNLRVTLRRTP